jgi:hypothetical protein
MASLSIQRAAGILVGAVIALAIPVSNGFVAILWASGVIQPDPDGSLIKALEAPGLAGILAGPIGIVIAALFARTRSVERWFLAIVVGLPLVTFAWFYAVASLGGLAGEPF